MFKKSFKTISQVIALSEGQRLAELEVENLEISASVDQLTRTRHQRLTSRPARNVVISPTT
jgi:hypothetical protein